MTYGYLRVSTSLQTTENQRLTIKNYCNYHHIKRISYISESISGTKSPDKRKLGILLKTIKPGDLIIVTELSRLGRSLIMILDTLQLLLEKHVKVISIKEGYELGDNIQSKVLAFAFGLSAEIERTLISERTIAGLNRAKLQGKHIGRTKGQKPTKYKLSGREQYIHTMISKGVSKSKLACELNVSWITLNKFIQANNL